MIRERTPTILRRRPAGGAGGARREAGAPPEGDSRGCPSWAVIFVPMPMPKRIIRSSLCTHLLSAILLRTSLGMGMGINVPNIWHARLHTHICTHACTRARTRACMVDAEGGDRGARRPRRRSCSRHASRPRTKRR